MGDFGILHVMSLVFYLARGEWLKFYSHLAN